MAPDAITLGILAGGRGTRLGGADKAALHLHGKTLLARTLAAFAAPGDAARLLSHPDPGAAASISGAPLVVVQDLRTGQPGPMAGLEALLHATPSAWLLTAPVDLALPDAGVAAHLRAAVVDSSSAAIVVSDADGLQTLVACWRVAAVLPVVQAALDGGRYAVRDLLARLPHRVIDVAPLRLGNLNRLEDFA